MKDHRQTFKNNPLTFKMIAIQGGTFDMGSDDNEAYPHENPIHGEILRDYWLCEFPVTQAVWAYVMQGKYKSDPAYFKGANRPVEQVSWDDIVKQFLPKLNAFTEGKRPEGTAYRLPTEAEWEYAAKGGKYWNTYPFKYSGSDKLNEVGWYDENSYGETKPVGLKTPNLLGLYDMSGNVSEWCYDLFSGYNFENLSRVIKTYDQVHRGGYWQGNLQECKSTSRRGTLYAHDYAYIGFRVALNFL